jgi:aerobic carbon-monoxide dehydrogenase small subunit
MADGSRLVSFRLNGATVHTEVDLDEPLLDTLRRLGETAPRESCRVGLCGCCAVLVDGQAVSSCLYWAVTADGAEVRTLRGLQRDPQVACLQRAIAEEGAAQCGYCTPGMVVTALELMGRDEPPGPEEVRDHMSGNLCRCTCYPELVAAIERAARDGDRP